MKEKKTNFSVSAIEKELQKSKGREKKREINWDAKKFFSVLMPPPNVTGNLHLGHALNNYIQDTKVRWKRDAGFETLWIPGFDHAGIATEMMVKKWIEENHFPVTEKKDLNYYLWSWTKHRKMQIQNQWEKMGLAINMEFEEFTYSEDVKKHVTSAFIKLFKAGLIYRDLRLVNWDPKAKTAISDLEIERKEIKGKIFFIRYSLVKSPEQSIVIATTRPETMISDQAIMVNPKDERYSKWIGQEVINPLNKEAIPIIGEEKINIEFGTGAVKCTPGHDFFDFEVGKKNNLKVATNIDENGNIIAKDSEFSGLNRFEAREKIVSKLLKDQALVKEQSYHHSVPFSQRTGVIVEPLLTKQWFIKTQEWAKDLEKMKKKINFFPKKYEKNLWNWLEKIQDWCISRQLKWGHQFPVYWHKKTNKIEVFEEDPGTDWERSKDVLDTWFSSGLWTLVNFTWSKHKNMQKIFPIDLLATSHDIIFFWIARMLFLHYFFEKNVPFKEILIHGLIRTEKNEKMSKTKGNVVDPSELIEKYGSDSLRFYLLSNHKIGEDFIYSETNIKSANQFLYKLWNMNNFVKKNKIKIEKNFDPKLEINRWILIEFENLKKEANNFFEKNLISLVLQKTINFTLKKLSNFYFRVAWSLLRFESEETQQTLTFIWIKFLKFLSPFLPNLSEYLLQEYTDVEIPNIILDNFKKSKLENVKKLFGIINNEKDEKEITIRATKIEEWEKNLNILNLMLFPFNKKIVKLIKIEK